MIGFHAQQAVEKLLKAVLANRNVEYPRVHDVDRLVDLLEAHDGSLPPHARQLDELTPWATQLRYDELLDMERLDRQGTRRLEPSPLTPRPASYRIVERRDLA